METYWTTSLKQLSKPLLCAQKSRPKLTLETVLMPYTERGELLPLSVERPCFIGTLIGMSSKEVTLSLCQVLRQRCSAEAIEVRERRRKAQYGNSTTNCGSYYLPQVRNTSSYLCLHEGIAE